MARTFSLGALARTGTAVGALALAGTTDASADVAVNYYSPPKLATQGKSVIPVSGPGTVVVKVLVAKSGSGTVQGVVRSTNHGDDATALDIAKNSTYRAATRGKTPQIAFYDFTLKFTAKGGGANVAGDAGETGGLAQYERQIRAGNYTGAQSGLKTYVTEHPTDAKAQLDLGVASALLNDASAAAAAFDKAGEIPEKYKSLAAKAYNDAAGEHIKAKEYPAAIVAAKRAVAIAPGPFTFNTLGTAEDASGAHADAIADLEKARSLAAADATFKPTDRATIDVNLVSAYVGAGRIDDAKMIAAEVTRLDPTQTNAGLFLAGSYTKSASELALASKFVESAAMLESAAAAAPSQSATLYARAALMYFRAPKNADVGRAQIDADRAIALAPNDALANFAAGFVLANQPGKTKDGLVILNRADELAKKGNDPALTSNIEDTIKRLGGSK
jgi:tetratricopeptide (TPR) repeat protein